MGSIAADEAVKKIRKKSNPHKANQWRPDPRQSLFLEYYLNPESETFSNCLQSALKAGYEQEYAEVLHTQMPTWLSEALGDGDMLKKAENNLKAFLQMDTMNKGMTKDGKTIYEFDDVGKIKVKADISKFVTERLNKKKWSARTELVGGLVHIKAEKLAEIQKATQSLLDG